ncbi:MAG: hypothetical protein OXF41_08355 [bacterium]|nr:hypothetical protein [bacterium]
MISREVNLNEARCGLEDESPDQTGQLSGLYPLELIPADTT